ncbi:hypothetical protein METBIDRAFT_9739 [Metschnikowia bicuspidata var. bicuspidata NRRL YB-4993]|uniref:Cleavage and polyadenylation specificity factor subunit 2 n=1 Tax=Metschnikowia bicuspidata var. bicuspidata NRRL YB-4993 TaxID=869754 RepID=A0A1A0HH25_9ASCO|nr:hypothetical protein METBIDRAFT_9739 [Metschnikowia bicuspidata var. bicuspidata NRRL YB-4993]OBA23479.1 hypothetical protein METBIDRAFT_9739 [Metschnikowia bicuspidata var. bicuspidata NRRL YB-4993]
MVSVTLLTSGAPRNACKATMLDFDGEIRVLADPGWDGLDPRDVLFLEKHLGAVDLMVLSQSTPEHIGAYVLLCVHFPMLMAAIPVYATVAVSQLARVATVEFYRARGVLGPVALALVEVGDVDEWLDKVVLVKYRQNMAMLENRLTVTAYNSGHTLGGAFWLLARRAERVVYAPSWNHLRDSFLNSAGFLSPSTGAPEPALVRPTALVTGAGVGSSMPHQRRAEKFLLLVDATLANGGAVLLPVAISGRFLELVHIVDEHLARLPGAAVPVYFLLYSGTKVLSYAGSLLDWMSAQLAKQHEAQAADARAYTQVPFEPAKVDLLLDPRELVRLPGPKIVFASGVDLAPGDLSAQAMQWLCQDEKLTLILTEKTPCGASDPVAARLYAQWHALAAQKNGGLPEDGVPVPLEQAVATDLWPAEEPLAGRELADFKARVAAARRQKLLAKVRDTKNKHILAAEDDSLSEDEPSSEDDAPEKPAAAESAAPSAAAAPLPAADVLPGHEVFVGDYISESLRTNKPIDIRVTVRMRPKQLMFPMPVSGKKRKVDDYGEVIDTKDFLLADDNSANNKLISESKRKFELHDKGRWGERDERRRRGPRHGQDRKLAASKNKLTPQEVLNNEVLQRNLDALFRPVKRVTPHDLGRPLPPLQLRCGLSFVDLAGRVDVRSLVMIVSVLRPQNVVLLPDASCSPGADPLMDGRRLLQAAFSKQTLEQKSSAASSAHLATSRFGALTAGLGGTPRSQSSEMAVRVTQPNVVEQIGGDGAGRLREFEVRLDEQLDALLVWQKLAGNHRITKVHGELGVYELQLTLNKQHADTLALSSQFILTPVSLVEDKLRQLPVLADSAGSGAGFGSGLAIGNVRLPELKKKLLALDMAAEFKGEGMLVVNDEVAIRKTTTGAYQGEDTGDLVLDGHIGPLYYRVRDCIKEMLAFV